MLELFNKYKASGFFTEALMVGRNLFNKNSGNADIFNEYFNLLCFQAQNAANTVADRRQFISQAEVALAFYSENTDLNEAKVKEIQAREAQLTGIVKIFNEEIDKQNTLVADKTTKDNNERLHLLEKLNIKLQNLSNKQEFDKVLGQIGSIDNILEKDVFCTSQQERYNQLTKHCTEAINKKLAVFERNENINYNQKAIEAYKSTFDFFKANENNENHMKIVERFFSFDASRLFNETLVYYNHVYSYILSKMNDDEKFILTKYAVMSERKEG